VPLDSAIGRVSFTGNYQKTTLDFAAGSFPLAYNFATAFANGTGAGQADLLFWDQRVLAPSTTEDLDLNGSALQDAYGANLAMARVKGIIVVASASNTNNVIVGNAASNGFITWVGGAAHTVTVRPGGLLALFAPDATAYAITAGTGDLLRIGNSGAGTSVTYDIVLVGASA
jgi:hypothetical protein